MAFIVQCGGCHHTFDRLDVLLKELAAEELAAAGDDERQAALHVLAAVISWWVDRSLARFPDRDRGLHAIAHAFACALGEQAIVVEMGVSQGVNGPHG